MTNNNIKERCKSTSPIQKFDEGPRQCLGLLGHSGPHYAKISDGRYIDSRWDDDVKWEDDDRRA